MRSRRGVLTLLSVNVGRSAVIGTRDGRPIRSAIGKAPVPGDTVEVGVEGLAGDVQRDRRMHGGPRMAVHAVPIGNLELLAAEAGREVLPGTIGENLTVDGASEDEVRVGDRFAWGDVVELVVTKPRTPCYKLDLVLGATVGPVVWATRRTGWYFAVDRPGAAPTTGPLIRLDAGAGPTIAELVAAKAPR